MQSGDGIRYGGKAVGLLSRGGGRSVQTGGEQALCRSTYAAELSGNSVRAVYAIPSAGILTAVPVFTSKLYSP